MRKTCILVPLLLLFPELCRGASDLRTKKFIHHSTMKSWSAAQAYCRETYTDLVTIADETENQDFVSGRGWIGLYREDSASKWKWSRKDEIANFTIWKDNYPAIGENCAFKYGNEEKWESDSCDDDHSFMCYEERLILVKEKKTWEHALEHCRALEAVDPSQPVTANQNHRYDLATLLTPDDHVFAREKAQRATTDEVWTGLRYLAGQWVWVSGGGEVTYGDIKSCQAQRSCGVLLKNGTTLFETRDCKERRNFLCYKKP